VHRRHSTAWRLPPAAVVQLFAFQTPGTVTLLAEGSYVAFIYQQLRVACCLPDVVQLDLARLHKRLATVSTARVLSYDAAYIPESESSPARGVAALARGAAVPLVRLLVVFTLTCTNQAAASWLGARPQWRIRHNTYALRMLTVQA